jgi:hypothetical protein
MSVVVPMATSHFEFLNLYLLENGQFLMEEKVRIKGEVVINKPNHALPADQSLQMQQKLNIPVFLQRVPTHQNIPL